MPVLIPPSGGVVSGALVYAWVDPQGIVRDLSQRTSPTLFVARGASGLGAPPVDIVADKLPFTAGSLVRRISTKPLEIDLPIFVGGDTIGDLVGAFDDLRAWFATGDESHMAPGYLRVTRPFDDAVRQIGCLYTGGLEGNLADGGPAATVVAVSLLAPDPYWTDITETVETYDASDLGTVLGVVNTGDVDAYPIWTITGPASSGIVLTNTTTGKSLSLTANGGVSLLAGDTLVIDTRPASQRSTQAIVNQDGSSFYNRVAVNSALWWLGPGANNFTVAANGTSGATAFELRWLPRYRGVLR